MHFLLRLVVWFRMFDVLDVVRLVSCTVVMLRVSCLSCCWCFICWLRVSLSVRLFFVVAFFLFFFNLVFLCCCCCRVLMLVWCYIKCVKGVYADVVLVCGTLATTFKCADIAYTHFHLSQYHLKEKVYQPPLRKSWLPNHYTVLDEVSWLTHYWHHLHLKKSYIY